MSNSQSDTPLDARTLASLPAVPLAQTPPRPAGVVDLWYADHESIERLDMKAAAGWMSADEQERLMRLRFERDRRLFAATRILVRRVLSTYTSIPPEALRFGNNQHGKPHVLGPAGMAPIHFNLSNAHGLIVCAVSTCHALLGVDTEPLARTIDAAGIAAQHFTADEQRMLHSVPDDRRQHEFLALWTLKESYLKACGQGLNLPLAWVSFRRDDNGIHVSFDPHLQDDARLWRFEQLHAPSGHLVAVGVNTGGAALSLRASRLDSLTPAD